MSQLSLQTDKQTQTYNLASTAQLKKSQGLQG